VEMCHCKTCADRLHVIVVITVNKIPYSPASCLIRFPFFTHVYSVHFSAFCMHYP